MACKHRQQEHFDLIFFFFSQSVWFGYQQGHFDLLVLVVFCSPSVTGSDIAVLHLLSVVSAKRWAISLNASSIP